MLIEKAVLIKRKRGNATLSELIVSEKLK